MAMNTFPVEPIQVSQKSERPSKHKRLRPTVLDFALIAIAPTLITISLWSLIFAFVAFLNHFGIGSSYENRLRMALMCFARGVVAACRIGMIMGTLRAMGYSVVLFLAGMLMMSRFFPQLPFIFQTGILSGIWGVGFLLTYDSTWMPDENAEQDGGILQQIRRREYITKLKLGTAKKEDNPDRVDGRLAQIDPQEELNRKIPHKPGTAILWFSLIILPILGIMQGLLPQATTDTSGNVTDGGARLVILQSTVVYVMTVLGLLMATSFIGLRRYLRFRQLEMPKKIVKRWFIFGGVLLVFLTIATLVIPRPAAEYSLAQMPWIRLEKNNDSDGSEDQNRPEASKTSVGKFDPGKDAKNADRTITDSESKHIGNQTQADAKNSSNQGDGKGEKKNASSRTSSSSKQDHSQDKSSEKSSSSRSPQSSKNEKSSRNVPNGKQTSNESQNGTENRQKSKNDQGKQNFESSHRSTSNRQQTSTDKNKKQNSNTTQNSEANHHRSNSQDKHTSDAQKKNDSQTSTDSKSDEKFETNPRQKDNWKIPKIYLSGGWIKWIVYVLAACVIGYLIVKNRAEILAAWRDFIKELRDFFARLFGRKSEEKQCEENAVRMEKIIVPHRRLSEFTDPFLSGEIHRWSAHKLLAESFGALQAWGRERGLPRGAEETALEYAHRIATLDQLLGNEAMRLATLYGRVIYYPESPPTPEQLIGLRRFWTLIFYT